MVKILTTKEVSDILHLHEVTIQKMASEGRITAAKIGREWRFRSDVIEKITLEGLPVMKKAGE